MVSLRLRLALAGAVCFAPGCEHAEPASLAACSSFQDEVSETSVMVRVSNEGEAPLYLGVDEQVCTLVPPYVIRDRSGNTLRPMNDCSGSCEVLQGLPGCGPACALSPAVRIEPGGSHELRWEGTRVEQVAMLESCYAEQAAAAATCPQLIAARSGQYEVLVRAWSDARCVAGACTCEGTAASCTLTGEAVVQGSWREATAGFTFPTEHVVHVAFD
jgi:hypothetical protein